MNTPEAQGASVLARLKNRSRQENLDFGVLLSRFAIERLLFRLSQSRYARDFIVKGAQLFHLWGASGHRSTRDLDLLGFGLVDEARLQQIFSELCRLPLDADSALIWDADSLSVAPIREDNDYGGIRVKLMARILNVRIPVQIDIGFGDAITPPATISEWPALLPLPAAQLLTYPVETVVAEKLQAATSLGLSNTRMKDFYDLYWLAQNRSFEANTLFAAIQATFQRRQTELPEARPAFLTPAFAQDLDKNRQWRGFVRKAQVKAPELPELLTSLDPFLWPLLGQTPALGQWIPGGPWRQP